MAFKKWVHKGQGRRTRIDAWSNLVVSSTKRFPVCWQLGKGDLWVFNRTLNFWGACSHAKSTCNFFHILYFFSDKCPRQDDQTMFCSLRPAAPACVMEEKWIEWKCRRGCVPVRNVDLGLQKTFLLVATFGLARNEAHPVRWLCPCCCKDQPGLGPCCLTET